MNTQLKALIALIIPHADKIKNLSKECEIECSIVMYSSEMPALNFEKETLAGICEIEASLDVDLYLNGSGSWDPFSFPNEHPFQKAEERA